MEELLTLEEASRYLKINKMTLYKMAWENKIPVYRVGRQWRFKKSVLDEWLEETRVSQELFQPRKKCIFLTGATGYLGSHLVPKFIEEGFSLKLLVRAKREDPRTRILECLSKIYPDKDKLSRVMDRIEILEGDMTQRNLGLTPKSIQGLSKEVSVLFHCAASVTFDEEKEAMLRKNNIEGIKNILSFAKRLPNIHLHYMGTAYVCGQRKGIVKEDELYLGQTFYNSYEKIKCEAEGLVRKWADKYNSRITIYRPSVIVGDYDTGQDYSNYGLYGIQRIVDLNIRKFKLEYKIGNRFLKDAGIKIEKDKFYIPLRVTGRDDKRLNLVTIDYALKTIIQIFKSKDNIGKTYHITNPNPPTVGLLKDCLCETLEVGGIRFVLPKDFTKEPIKPWEKIFDKNIGIYTPYLLLDEPIFDDTNTQAALKGTEIKQRCLDKEIIMKLLGYAHLTNYGKKI